MFLSIIGWIPENPRLTLLIILAVQVLFLCLKLFGVLNTSWWIVVAPTYASILLLIIIFTFLVFAMRGMH